MAHDSDSLDLAALRLSSGEGRRLELTVRIEPLELGGDAYAVLAPDPPAAEAPAPGGEAPSHGAEIPADALDIPVTLDISRMTGNGYALHLHYRAALSGPCMRCLEPARPGFEVDGREVSQPGEGEELESPYVADSQLDLAGWARDALVLGLPPAILCRPDCAGLCPICGADLNRAGPEHHHEAAPDPRWAALAQLRVTGDDSAPEPPGSP